MSVPELHSWVHYALIGNGTFLSGYVNGIPVDLVSDGGREEVVILPDRPVIFFGKRDSKAYDTNADFHLDEFFVFPFALDQNDLVSFQ